MAQAKFIAAIKTFVRFAHSFGKAKKSRQVTDKIIFIKPGLPKLVTPESNPVISVLLLAIKTQGI